MIGLHRRKAFGLGRRGTRLAIRSTRDRLRIDARAAAIDQMERALRTDNWLFSYSAG
jgi:hypothetical protein